MIIRLTGIVVITALLQCCTSGKSAYNRGDYYEAVMKAIMRLRKTPNHKKASEILKISYPTAIEYLEYPAKNTYAIEASVKYRKILENYKKINNLFDAIKRSPAALRIIPDPINKYKEMENVKEYAAEEAYDAGVQALMQDTREEAKKAYYLFLEANSILPQYRESKEMMKQAKFNATLKVLVQPEMGYEKNWSFASILFTGISMEFVKFYSPYDAESQKIKNFDHTLRIEAKVFFEKPMILSKKKISYSENIKVGEVEINGKKEPKYKEVHAIVTRFVKSKVAKGVIRLVIMDTKKHHELLNREITSNAEWNSTWGLYSGNEQALSKSAKNLCKRGEKQMPRDYLNRAVKQDLDQQLRFRLERFYQNY